ncbi:MAG: AAA family ATPase [Thermoleophilia bacterium]|nr:AAA family ATPase [Thermoleophilia bacterium]
MSAASGASRRTVTVLFCDVVDSTLLGEALDPEALRSAQTEYFDAVREVLERHGGTVEKFIGDAVMAVFGLPTLHEDDALRALHAASELRIAIAPLDQRLDRANGLRWRIRVGVATGEVVAGDAEDAQSFATGTTVVVAQRLESSAQPSEVLIDDATYRLAAGAALVEPVEPVAAKGKAEPVAAWRLVGVQSGVPGVPRRLDTPLVGRRGELARLREAFDTAVSERRCRLVGVIGPAGIGKSRLVREFIAELAHEATVRVGRCPPYGDGVTFWPVVQVLPDETLEGTTEEIFRRVRRSLEELAAERPLVLCLDDLHWAEPTLLNLVDYLHGLISGEPVLLLCMSRAELLEARPQWAANVVVLSPLSPEEAEALLTVLDAPAEARRRIAEAAEGNPLFAEQMAAMALEAGPTFAVPPSIKALLAARLDRLPAVERAIVERAAVIGREFPLRAVAALAPEELRPEATSHVLTLVRKDLVEPYPWAFRADEDGFRFRHGLIREAAYEGIPKELRARLHERYARWFERSSGEDVIVGYHLEQVYVLRTQLGRVDEETEALAGEAGDLLGAAGERALRRADIPAAINLLTRATSLLPPGRPRRAALLLELGQALMKAGRFAEAGPALEQTLEAARAAGDRRIELRATIELQQLLSFTSPAGIGEETARVATEAIPELEALGDEAGVAKAWRLLSDVHVMSSRFGDRAEALEHALEHARNVPGGDADIDAYTGLLAQALHWGPTPTEIGIERCRSFLASAEESPALRATVYAALGVMLAGRGEFEDARLLYRESADLHEKLGLTFRAAVTALLGAEIELLAGDAEAAERELRAAYRTLEAMGETGNRAVVSAQLALVLAAQGRDDEAWRFARLAGEIGELGDAFAAVLERSARARLLTRADELGRAAESAGEALSLAEATDCPNLRTTAALALAEALAAGGDLEQSRSLLERARAAFEAKGNLVESNRVAALLVSGQREGVESSHNGGGGQ